MNKFSIDFKLSLIDSCMKLISFIFISVFLIITPYIIVNSNTVNVEIKIFCLLFIITAGLFNLYTLFNTRDEKKFIQKLFEYEVKNNQKEILIKDLLKKNDNFILNFISNLNNEQKVIFFKEEKIFNFLCKIDEEKDIDYLFLDFIKYVYEKEVESCYHNISYLFWFTNNDFVEKIKERLYKKYKENIISKERSVIELSEIKTLDKMEIVYYLSTKNISEVIENQKLFDYYLKEDDDEIVFDVFQDMDLNQKLNSFNEEKFIAYSKKLIDTQKNEDKEYFYSNYFKEVVSEIADKNLSNYYQQVLFLFDNLNTDEINIIKYRMYSIKEKIKENKTNIISI